MIKKSFFPLNLVVALFLLLTLFLPNVQGAAPSSVSGWTFFVQITDGRFGMGKSGSFLLCLSGSEFRMVSLSNIDDVTGTYTYQATGTQGKVTLGNQVMTFSFEDERRGHYELIRGGDVTSGYQLGRFSAVGGSAPDSVENAVLDFNGRRVDMPMAVNYRLVTGSGNTYFRMDGNVPSATNFFAVQQLNASTTRLFFNDAVLGTGHTHLMFITPTSGMFAYKIGSGKAYEKGTFTLQPAAAPVITKDLQDQTVEHGGRAIFSIEVTGAQPITYQWFKDLVPIPGANQSTYVVDPVDNEGRFATGYYVRISNFFGSTVSYEALLETTCPTTLSKNFHWFPYTGGTGDVVVTSSDCSFSVQRDASWISPSSNGGINESGPLTFTARLNTNAAPRTTFLRIGTKQFKVTQQGAPAPNDVKGTTLRLSGINDTNYSPFYYFTTLTGTNLFFGVTQESGTLTNAFPYTYSRLDATNALFKNDTDEYHLEFANHWQGSFVYSNVVSGTNFTGTFTLSQSRLDGNLDGFSDLLWQHTDGRIRITSIFGTNSPPESESGPDKFNRIWGVDDLNGDSLLNIIRMDSERRLVGNFTNLTFLRNGIAVPTAWRPVSVQDLSHDGRPDFLFQNQNRKISYWQMAGTNFTRSVSVRDGTPIGANWLAVAIADMNLDRQQDIIFWNSENYKTAVWLMNDGDFFDVHFLAGGQTPGAPWRLRGVADMDYDGQNDLLWQNRTSGVVKIWHLNGLAKRTPPPEDVDISDPPADPAWILLGPK